CGLPPDSSFALTAPALIVRAGFRKAVFFGAAFFAVGFFAAGLFAAVFLAAGFFAADVFTGFFAAGLRDAVFRAGFFPLRLAEVRLVLVAMSVAPRARPMALMITDPAVTIPQDLSAVHAE